MTALELAALIAAVFWALLVCAGLFLMFRLGRFLAVSSRLVADVRERGDVLLTRAQAAVDGAQAAVDRAGRQLDRAESVTASMDELGAGMTELAGHVTALAGLGRAIAVGPVGRAAALAYGVRHAVSLRRAARRRLTVRVERGELARSGPAASAAGAASTPRAASAAGAASAPRAASAPSAARREAPR